MSERMSISKKAISMRCETVKVRCSGARRCTRECLPTLTSPRESSILLHLSTMALPTMALGLYMLCVRVMVHNCGITRCTGWSTIYLCWLGERSTSVRPGARCMHSRQVTVQCYGISIRMFSSVGNLDFHREALDSPVRRR